MAEFQDVMEQWKRRCKHCTDDYSDCNIHSIVCDGFCKMKNFADFMSVEKEVMAWAAEHPEPVYPTWWEWLAGIGAVTRKVKPDVASELIETGLLDPIPADMAQRLGIAPKK